MQIDNRITKTYIKGKGMGYVATVDIPANTILLKEKPSYKTDNKRNNLLELIYIIINDDNKSKINNFKKYYPKKLDNRITLFEANLKYELELLKKSDIKKYNYLIENCSKEELQLNYMKCIQNGFMHALYGSIILLNGSIFNHSCDPNVLFGNNGDETIFITIRDIKKGEELCNSYISIYLDREKRQKTLLNQYGFICKCTRCINNNDLNIDRINKIKTMNKLIYNKI